MSEEIESKCNFAHFEDVQVSWTRESPDTLQLFNLEQIVKDSEEVESDQRHNIYS